MTDYSEGDQLLSVPSGWTVIKMDEHPYYQYVSGKGYKSVDFMLIDPAWGLVLLEIKDYGDKSLSPETKSKLRVSLEKKHSDSIKLILAIDKMHRRKWYYRLLIKISREYSLLPKRSRSWLIAADMIRAGRYHCINEVQHGGFSD